MISSTNINNNKVSKALKKPLLMWSVMLLLLLIGSLFALDGHAQDPFIPKYDAVKRSERCFTVTWEDNNQFGAVWWADKVDFSQDTAFNFVVYMGDRDGNGADGLAFVMHQDPRDTITDPAEQVIIDTDGRRRTWDLGAATGDDGGGLGFAMHESRVDDNQIPGPHANYKENHKIQASVAVEIDTWNNRDVPDGRNGTDANGINQSTSPYYGWDHTAVIYNGDIYGEQQVIEDANGNTGRILPLKPGYAFGTGNNPDGSVYHNIEDDRCYMFQIRWITNSDGTQTLQLWADVYNGTTNLDGLQMIMTHTDDMLNNVFGGNSIMRFGFTGSTGGSINEQTICLLGENLKPFAQDDYASIPMNTTTIVDVEANDNDPDGDQLHVPIIIDPARYGQAIIFDSLDVNYMRYTPNTNYVGRDTVGYVTCDVNSTKCYAKCDTAFVYVDIGCVPFDIQVNATSANTVCSVTVPANGAAEAVINGSALAGTLWYEGFEDLNDGTTSDNGTSSWSSTSSGSCHNNRVVEVESNVFRVNRSNCEIIFETEVIDISGVSDINLSVDLRATGSMENDDFLNVYYILDGGTEVPLSNGIHQNNFGSAVATANGLNGNNIKIVIRAQNSGADENYYWDNLHVTAIGAGVPNVTFNWYEGSAIAGPIVFSGTLYNTMHSGQYTVQAIDNNTGCPSNPYTVTIDSTGYNLSGGFIEQRSSFTNCELPYDGELGAGIFNGSDTVTTGFTFEWYYQEDPKLPTFIQKTGPIAQNLESREYTVVITELATGCDTTINAEVPNEVTIPTVTATKLADVTSCTDPNSGAAEAHVGGITDGYRFEWWAGPSIGSGPAEYTGSTVSTFPVGTYTVQAIDSITSCPSDPATVTIDDLTDYPDLLVTVDQQQISCDPARPTGQLSGAVDESGTPTTSGYTFNWYKGPNDILPARPGYAGGPTADSLEAGTYRLVVIEDVTNCSSFLDTLIQDMTVTPPDITVAATDVTSCATPNGTITVTLDPSLNPADFVFEVYSGNGVITDSLLLTTANNVIQDLDIGNYTVIAIDNNTYCASDPVTTTINDARVNPDASIATQAQVSCDPLNYTGSLTVSMGFGAISDYTYEWFDNAGNPIPPSSVDGEVISNLDSGNYEVRITENITQCSSTYFPMVNIAQIFPIDSVAATPSTFCAPNGNGELRGFVLNGTHPNYTFIWRDNAGIQLTETAATVSSLAPGDYTLQIQDDNTLCLSNIAPVTVYDNTVIPIPTLIPTDNSSCDINNPNGQIEVTTTNEAPTYGLGEYTYAWFNNTTNNPETNVSGSGEVVSGLNQDTYRLEIVNNITGCSNSALSVINNINIKPVIDNVDVTDATRCSDPYLSGAEVTSISGSAILTDYTFTWVNTDLNDTLLSASSSPIISDATDSDGFAMPPGNYTVTAFNSFGCPSDVVAFEVKDLATPPVFTLSAYNNISCDPGHVVGSLVASRPNDSYTISQYEWMDGLGNAVAAPTTSDSTLLNLDAGLYSVRITDAATACTSLEYADIQDAPANIPIIQNISLVNLTRCDIENGELGYQVFPYDSLPPLDLVARTYTFYLTNGTDSYNLNTAGASDNVNFTGLASGDWDAYVVDDFTRCQSLPITNTLTDAPEIIITTTINKKPASCVGNDGEAMVEVESIDGTNKDPNGPGFDFWWYEGSDFSTPFSPNLTGNTTNWAQEADNLASTYYTVNVLDRNTQCEKDTTFFMPPDQTPVFLNAVITDATQCFPGNGGLLATVVDTTFGFGKDYSSYNYIMFEGEYADLSWTPPGGGEYKVIDGALVADPANGPVDFGNDIEPGIYTIIAQEKDPTTLCFGEPYTVEIGLDFEFPEFAFTVTPDRSCVGGTGTGQIEETALPVAKIDYRWYVGTDTTVPENSLTNITTNDLYVGAHTLVAEITTNLVAGDVANGAIDGLGCVQDSLVLVPKVLDNLQLAATPTPNNNCAPYDGTIEIDDVIINGVASGLPAEFADYTILDSNLNPPLPAFAGDGTTTPWSGIGPGIYYLQARNTLTNCYTDYYQTEIDDLSQDPEIYIAVNSLDYACDPLLANGELEAFTTGNSQNTLEYNFTWYENAISAGNEISDVPVASGLFANNSSQLYIIQIEDTSGVNKGCISSRPITLTHQPTTVFILSPNINVTPQTNCAPVNGSIEITQIEESDGSVVNSYTPDFSGNYFARLLDDNLNAIADPYANFNAVTGFFGSNDIPADKYYVQASNVATGCSYGPVTQVIVKDISRNPIISAILDNPDYACFGPDPGNLGHTGQLTPSMIGGSDGDDVTSNFVVTWTSALTASAPPGGAVATNLWPDTYTLTVEDVNGLDQGCISTRDYIVPVARHNIEVFASGGDQTICNPDGQIQIDRIEVNGAVQSTPENDWTGFLLDANKNDLNAPESGFISIPDPYQSIAAGTYYVRVQDNSTLCYSNADLVVIHDASTDPVIDMSVDNPQWSLNPNPLSWTGALSASVEEVDGTVGMYNIDWYEGIGTATTMNQTALSLDFLDQGLYTMTAENTATGCTSTYYVYLPYEYLEPTFLTVLTPKTICAPNNGAIEMTDMALDGNPDDLDDYDFMIYHDNYTNGDTPDNTIPGDNTGTIYNNINTGSYYIIAHENWWWVESYPVKVDIADSTTNPIINFDITNYQPVTSCDQSIFTNGALGIEVYEDNTNPYLSPPYNYGYTWHEGSNVDPAQVIAGETSNTISGLESGIYTVQVINLANNCQSEATYEIDDESVTPVVLATQSPNTNCDLGIANGIVDANVINSNNPHLYQWYAGGATSSATDFEGQVWRDRTPGLYTVVAVDQMFSTCISEPVIIEVKNATENPVVLINEISPVTHCDPERPDGVLSAVTEQGVSGHTFTWYLDGELYSTGPIANDLGLLEYELVVVNNVTRCETSMLAGPTSLQSIVPPPDVDILNDRTSCLKPDGQATATIDGNVVDYIFRYYNKFSGDELTNFYQNYVIHDLDTSTYLVTAEDRETGCISDPTEFVIANDTYFPIIDVIATPSNCMDPTGQIEVIVSDMTRDFKATWIGDNGFEAQGKELVFIPIGNYDVIVEGSDGCNSEAKAEIKGDIIIYNAVSANQDGLNEFFQILCMEFFLDNSVKIYNRAGLLVYEQDYYDPTDPSRRFEGISNKGASIAGTELPIGTYFYVADKNDGSKPKVGYLELNR
jgi:hypothetical protein